jgi:DNA-binding NarL/FixJ family response regulator
MNTSNGERMRVTIASENTMLREGLHAAANKQHDMSFIGGVSDAKQFRDILDRESPNVALIDTDPMQKTTAAQFLQTAIGDKNRQIACLMLQEEPDFSQAREYLTKGAKGVISTSENVPELMHAIREISTGKLSIDQATRERLMRIAYSTAPELSPIETLTSKEREVLTLLGQGRKTSEIADTLSISPKTIDTHVMRMKVKLDCKNRIQLLKFAIHFANGKVLQ